jgi:hypothetical protein
MEKKVQIFVFHYIPALREDPENQPCSPKNNFMTSFKENVNVGNINCL